MRKTLLSLIALLSSCIILYLGIGLMNILVPSRMRLEGMTTDTIGLVLSMYFVGMFTGAIYSKQLVKRVGHIRVFAGSLAIEAICILAFTLETNAILWGGLRVLLGFSHASLLTAMESWLSDTATEETRGKMLAVYNACIMTGLFCGQFLMGVADPSDNTLFVLVGILFCLAALPVLFSSEKGPIIETVAPMSIISLFKISPLGVVTCLIAGAVYSALFNLLPVFASEYNISGFKLSLFMGCAVLGAFLLQFPVGLLSDRLDRRTVLLGLLLLSSVLAVAIVPLAALEMMLALFVVCGVTSGIVACYYPLSVAEAFDKLKKTEMVAAMGSMLLAYGVGGAIGPYTASLIMEAYGSASLFYCIAVTNMCLALFTIYRMTVRKALPVEDQEGFVMQSEALSTSVHLDPRMEYSEPEAHLSSEAELAMSIAESDPAAAVRLARALTMKNPEKGTEVAAAVAQVPGIDVMRLYEVMKEAAPYQILDITQAIVKAKPELAADLVSRLAEWYPQQVVPVAIEVGRVFPDMRIEMARIAVESAPESATQVAEYYAHLIAEERESIRPADREDDTSESDALNMATELWDANPDQALDIAVTMAESVPETAVAMTEEYMAGYDAETDALSDTDQTPTQQASDGDDSEYVDAVEWVSRLSEAAPEQALDVAATVVEAVPESMLEITEEYLSAVEEEEAVVSGEPETPEQPEQNPDIEAEETDPEEEEHQKAIEWLTRMSQLSPEMSLNLAVKIVEAVPESAQYVAAEVARLLHESYQTENSIDNDDSSEIEDAVELVNRLREVAPDNAEEVAVAVLETIPEAASDVVDAISSGDESREGEWVNSIDQYSEKPNA
ncbi:MFS transporter [Amphritea sp. 1_MG-2023]|uniref:MFS transporter n=1 Tax=Amphritea sp. 1_MG-2023 TaxID=3062670 RepID=UPI0026E2A0AC|nr:MFS transporter [Amphritea sp. 1_MG-2023]MDO6563151.1 MFS transporter [Amphritea sp. 1_MG-2023]